MLCGPHPGQRAGALRGSPATDLRAFLHDQDARDGPRHGHHATHRRGPWRPHRSGSRARRRDHRRSAARNPMTTPLRIAIADDEPDLREYLQETLTDLGYQVVAVAATGQELVDLCRTTNPDLVITDIKMPEMD